VVGETPNLAARLQALAGPGTLVIAESTRRQTGGLFELLRLDRRDRRATFRALGLSDILRGVHRDDLVVLPAQSFMAKQAPSPVETRV
jgi:class 3 adenylate cyclase